MVGFTVYKNEITADSEQFKQLIIENINNYISQHYNEIVSIEETDTTVSVSVEF